MLVLQPTIIYNMRAIERLKAAANLRPMKKVITLADGTDFVMYHAPLTMAERISQAAEAARRSDHERLLQAQIELGTAGADLRRIAGTIRTAAEQRQRIIKAAGVGALVGLLLWAGFAGPIARSLPDSWQVPERMAKRTLGVPTFVDAGARLLKSADPARWVEVIEAARLSADNREVIALCKAHAKKERGPVRCQLRIDR